MMNEFLGKADTYNVAGGKIVSLGNADDEVLLLFLKAKEELSCVTENFLNSKGSLNARLVNLYVLTSYTEINAVRFSVKVLILYSAKLGKIELYRLTVLKSNGKLIALALYFNVEEIHLGCTDEACNELVLGVVKQIGRCIYLLNNAKLHNYDPRTHSHRFYLVVSNVNKGSFKLIM